MKIEHIGICVDEPISMGIWYRDNLGFEIIRADGDDTFGVSFLRDRKDGTVIEIAKIPESTALDIGKQVPLQFHIAIDCEDPQSEADRLLSAGAEWIGESLYNSYPGEKLLLRDPWGYTIQLLNRQTTLQN